MPSLNAPKKSKATNSSAVKTAVQKKTINSKARKSACGCEISSQKTATAGHRRSHLTTNSAPAKKNGRTHTKIVVSCNCGFSNSLYIRGEGIKDLSWEKGTLMNCTKADEWVWETDTPFTHAQIKVLLNDKEYELGENHDVDCGKQVKIAPQFIKQ